MADYKYAGPTIADGVTRLADGREVPNDEGNRHWISYLAYVDGGGETDPWKTQAELDAIAEYIALMDEVETEKINAGILAYTPTEVRTYFTNQIEGAATPEDKLDALVELVKKLTISVLQPVSPE